MEILLTNEQEKDMVESLINGGTVEINCRNRSILKMKVQETIAQNNLIGGKKSITLEVKAKTRQYFDKYIKSLYKQNNDL